MTNSIIEYLNRDKRTVDALVDIKFAEVAETLAEVDDMLPDVMPEMDYPDRMLLILKLKRFPTIGYIVAPDGEIPIDSPRLQLSEELLGNCKIAKSRGYLEKDFEAFNRMQTYFTSIGPGAAAAAQALSDYFLSQPAELVEGVKLAATLLAFQVMVLCKCAYTDPMTGAIAELDYTAQSPVQATARGATLPNLAPPITSGTLTWDQAATAQGISDLVNHLNSYYVNTEMSMYPDYIVMHRQEFINLQNQRLSKQEAASLRGVNLSGADLTFVDATLPPTIEEMNTIIARRLVQQGGGTATIKIVIFDKKVWSKDVNGVTSYVDLLPLGYYCFAMKGMMERAYVPTVEKDFAPGLFSLNEVVSKAPRKERSVVIGCTVPLLKDPRLVASRNVMNTASISQATPYTTVLE